MKVMHRLAYSVFFLGIVVANSLNGQTFQSNDADKIVPGSKIVRMNAKNKSIQFIQLQDDNLKSSSIEAKAWLGKSLKLSNKHNFTEISTSSDESNFTHTKYQLIYKKLPVEGQVYNVHSKTGKIASANGEYTIGTDVNETPGLKEPVAFDFALNHVHAKKYQWDNDKTKRPVGTLVFLPVDDKYVLAYKFDIYALEPLSRQYIFIDANTGKVLKALSRIHEGDVIGTAQTMYNGTVSITTDSYLGAYRLRETGRGQGIETYDLNKGYDYSTAVDFTDADNNWNTTTDLDHAAYDAHYGSEATYDYYMEKFGRNSFDGNGAKLISYVHAGVGYNNAFWNGQFMTYGDGDGVLFNPLTTMDVVGHEITHAVTQYTAGLIYWNESGALNESFSDIFGVAIDFYKNPSTANFQLGEQMSPSNAPLRNMSNPNAGSPNQPDTYKGNNWYTGTGDNGGVHYNSGVQNFWFYLLCQGGTGTNDIGTSYKVNAIGMDKASRIAYRNLTVYLTPNSTYADARFYSIQAAKDLYGDCSVEATAVIAAWNAVGLGDASDCDSPKNLTSKATARNKVNLTWNKNTSNNNVIIAYSTQITMGNPVNGTAYSVGSNIPGGGKVLYNGSATTFNHSVVIAGSNHYYKAWSVKAGNSYSGGVTTKFEPPVINAGPDQTIIFPAIKDVNLSVSYTDSLPVDSLTFKWEKTDGNGSVTFDNSNSKNTIAHFDKPGIYTLKISMNCYGLTSVDYLQVNVDITEYITSYSGLDWFAGLEVKDNFAYLTQGGFDGVSILDVSDISNPIKISTYEIPGIPAALVHVEGKYAYISHANGGGLTILNIEDKYHPTFISFLDFIDETTGTYSTDFIVNNGIVYFPYYNFNRLYIIDATNPTTPHVVGEYECTPLGIALKDNYLYVSQHSEPTLLLDISEPSNPLLVNTIPILYMGNIAPFIQGEYFNALQFNWGTSQYDFVIYDISVSETPTLIGSIPISSGNDFNSFSIEGNYVYINDGLYIIDISDKHHPFFVSKENKEGYSYVKARNNIVFACYLTNLDIYKTYLDNLSPYVYAGMDNSIDVFPYTLKGEVYDEGLPTGSTIISTWSKTSGPGTVSFSNANILNPSVSFNDIGNYVLRLSSSDGQLASYDEVLVNVPFAITQQPLNQSVCINNQVEFLVNAKSTTSITYKWYKNNQPITDGGTISGSTTNKLIIQNTTLQDAGSFYCRITSGNVYSSNIVNLVVNQKPTAPIVGTITQPTATVATGSVVLSGLPTGSWTINPGNVIGSTSTKTITNLAAATYNFTVTNASGCTSAASTPVVIIPYTGYCNAAGVYSTYDWVAKVTVNGSIKTSGAALYSNYTSTIFTATAGTTIGVTLTPGTTLGTTSYPMNWKVWIDYNGDKDFTDAGEQVISIAGTSIAPVSANINIPCGSISTRMRVAIAYGGPASNGGAVPAPCGTVPHGEYEDYTINITKPTAPIVGTITHPTCTVAKGSVVLSSLPTGNWTLNPGAIGGTGTSYTKTGLAAGTYNFTVTNSSGCISLPSANIVINAQPATPTAPIVGVITQPTATVATGGVVLSGLPTGSWTINPGNIIGSTSTKTITNLAAATYNFTVTNASGCTSVASTPVVIIPFSGAYCNAAGVYSTYDWVAKVTVNGIIKTSGAALYSNYTSTIFTATAGTTIGVTLTPGTSLGTTSYPMNWKAWIDYNGDKDFTDAGEQVISIAGTSIAPVSANINIPSGVISTRMRVAIAYGGPASNGGAVPTPCGTVPHGEYEDYTINITPVGLMKASNENSFATGVNETLPSEKAVLAVYPNPAQEMLNFTLNLNEETIKEFKVIDLIGKTILRKAANEVVNNQIELGNDIINGLYILQVVTDKGQYLQRFTVEK